MTNKTLKVTMRLETEDGEITEMIRKLNGQHDEDNLVCLFSEWSKGSGHFCSTGIALGLTVFFSDIQMTKEMEERLTSPK